MKFNFLGTGGSISSKKRGNTSIAFDSSLLVDCSGNPSQSLLRIGVKFEDVKNIIFTHHHTDHIYGFPSLVHQIFLTTFKSGREPLSIYGTPTTIEVVKNLLDSIGLYQREGMFEINFISTSDEEAQSITIDNFFVETFPVVHGRMPTIGLMIKKDARKNESVIYSADTEPCKAVLDRCKSGGVLIHECSSFTTKSQPGHTTLHQIKEIALSSSISKIFLVHIPSMTEEEEKNIKFELKENFGDRIVIAEDFQSVEI